MYGKKSFWDIGRCNCWPKISEVFKTKPPFFFGSKTSSPRFHINLDRFYQSVQDSFVFSFSKLFAYDDVS